MDIALTEEQENEMTELASAIEERGQKELKDIIEEAESIEEGNGEVIKKVWEQDVTSRKKFFEDQLKNSTLSE